MKIAVNMYDDSLKSIYNNRKVKDFLKGCYFIKLDDNFKDSKMIKQGCWQQLKDEKGKLLWKEDNNMLKPQMGYVVDDEEVEIEIFNNLSFWSISEILKLKYKNITTKDHSRIYYEEFVDLEEVEDLPIHFSGNLNLGKKVCFGEGIIVHELRLKNNKIYFDCEYENEMPNIEISLDGKTYSKVTKLPWIHDFRKATYKAVYLKINDFKNPITAYSIGFNGDIQQTSCIGRGIV